MPNSACGCHAIHIWHEHIHKYHIWQDAGTQLDSSFAIARFAHQFQVVKTFKKGDQTAAHHRIDRHGMTFIGCEK
ncbi:MAG: hypothetical protein IPF56_06420 [Chloroflexi bacterium]|nr:hypothetical protein [Chloroflexota bacterium]